MPPCAAAPALRWGCDATARTTTYRPQPQQWHQLLQYSRWASDHCRGIVVQHAEDSVSRSVSGLVCRFCQLQRPRRAAERYTKHSLEHAFTKRNRLSFAAKGALRGSPPFGDILRCAIHENYTHTSDSLQNDSAAHRSPSGPRRRPPRALHDRSLRSPRWRNGHGRRRSGNPGSYRDEALRKEDTATV